MRDPADRFTGTKFYSANVNRSRYAPPMLVVRLHIDLCRPASAICLTSP